jgi:hypothetical protein
VPRRRRLTEELDEWLGRDNATLAARMAAEVEPGMREKEQEQDEILLLTERKPI